LGSALSNTWLKENFFFCLLLIYFILCTCFSCIKAAGLIPVAHRSGGPLADIIVPFGGAEQPVGYLAETKSEYADALLRIFALNNGDRTRIQTAARAASAHKFADSQFAQGFLDSLLKNQLLNL